MGIPSVTWSEYWAYMEGRHPNINHEVAAEIRESSRIYLTSDFPPHERIAYVDYLIDRRKLFMLLGEESDYPKLRMVETPWQDLVRKYRHALNRACKMLPSETEDCPVSRTGDNTVCPPPRHCKRIHSGKAFALCWRRYFLGAKDADQ